MPEYLEFISIDPWRLVMTWGNLLILCAIVKRLLFRPVQAILQKREEQIAEDYRAAEGARAEAQALRQKYEQKLEAARAEAGELLDTAARRAAEREEAMLREAREQAGAVAERARRELEREQEQARSALKREISGIAIDLAERVVEREISPADHEKLIEEFLDQVGDAS